MNKTFERLNDDLIQYNTICHSFANGFFNESYIINVKNWTERKIKIEPNFYNEDLPTDFKGMGEHSIEFIKREFLEKE